MGFQCSTNVPVSIKNKYMYLIQMYLEARISTCTHTSYWHATLHIVISGVFRHENEIVSYWILRLFFLWLSSFK